MPYSPGKPIWEVQRELGLDRVIKLASNENPLGPSPKALAAVAEALPELHRYPDAQAVDLRRALADRYGLPAGQIIVTNGGDELITLLARAYLDVGDEIVVPGPSFSEYEFGGRLMGANVREVPLAAGYRYDEEAILAAVNERTKLVFLCSPNNPTGTILRRSQLLRILGALPAHALVVLDAAYRHYATEEDYSDGIEFVRSGHSVLVLQTFSKIYGLAGVRVGFGLAPAEVIENIYRAKEPFNVNALAQTAAAAALGDDEHVLASRRLVAAERERLYRALRELGVGYTESMANFILVELGEEAKAIYERLMAQGIIVRYGGTWGLPRHVRVTVGTAEENDEFVRRLAEVLGPLKSR